MDEINQKSIGDLTVSEAMVLLTPISLSYGLRLNRLKEFKLARLILVNLYSRELI
tara:strand:- start:1018 stop:1182 length:165 start_codon:yes stop_codon:yes gene_type:complete